MSNKAPHYDLYYNPFSICSLQVLYTLRLKGNPKSAADAVDPKENFIDIYTGEQWSEEYLEIHPRGTVCLGSQSRPSHDEPVLSIQNDR